MKTRFRKRRQPLDHVGRKARETARAKEAAFQKWIRESAAIAKVEGR